MRDAPHIMLDCGRVNALRLRFLDRETADLALAPGVHAIGRDAHGQIGAVTRQNAWALFCNDARGVWLQAGDPTRGVHVNGRRIRRMALLRAGDSLFAEGVEMVVLGDAPAAVPGFESPEGDCETRMVLRGVGGQHHGRALTLDTPRTLGSARDCDIRIDDAALADRHLALRPHARGVLLTDVHDSAQCQVNGHSTRAALLRPGDQLVVEGRHRFVIESPSASAKTVPGEAPMEALGSGAADDSDTGPARRLRVPWLLVAAALIAVSLSLLMLYGAR